MVSPPRRPRAAAPRRLLARHLVGAGLELGPGQHPFALTLPGTQAHYADRWHAAESGTLFPRQAAREGFTEPDLVADFNTERLGAVPDASQNFVIASHVLEHLAEPIGLLADMHRVLRPGGVALILLPDRHRTKDQGRAPTPLSHLVAEHEAGVEEVGDDHLVDWMCSRGITVPKDDAARRAAFDLYRRRSVHAHCWDASEFVGVLLWTVEHLGLGWEFVDGVLPTDEFPPGVEFGFVLRRSDVELDRGARGERLATAWGDWYGARDTPRLAPVEKRLVRAHRRARRALWPSVLAFRRARGVVLARLRPGRTGAATHGATGAQDADVVDD